METLVFLLSDGITNGALYSLVALSLVVVYTVTRIVNIAQGEYVVLGAMSFASILSGAVEPLCLLVVGAVSAFTIVDLAFSDLSAKERSRLLGFRFVWVLGLLVCSGLAWTFPGVYWLAALTAVLTTASVGPIVYRMTVEPHPEASPVVLLIISLGVYLVLHNMAVLIWGAEARYVPAIVEGGLSLGSVFVTYQSFGICALSVTVMLALYLFSERTLGGQALHAVAINRTGAQLCGIPVQAAGQLSFALSAAFSALSGLLLAPLVTANCDMGFIVGLKAFVGATLGGIVEYPIAVAGVALVGTIESVSAYWASAFKDAIVFMLVIPILLWRNAVAPLGEEH